jgi:hypothetical protein
VVWAASVAGSSAASPRDGSGEMALLAAPGVRAFARAAVLEGGVGLGRVGRFAAPRTAHCVRWLATRRVPH